MGIRIEKKTLAYCSITGMGIEPEYLCITGDMLREYIKEHPFPQDPAYSEEDLLFDIKSSGVWFFVDEIGEDTKDWICEMLYELV